MHSGKLIIFSAPSGSGKTTLVRHILSRYPQHIEFSISATSRQRRGSEENGKDYYYLTVDEFKKKDRRQRIPRVGRGVRRHPLWHSAE